jgi:hypothetical protein
MMCMLCKRAPVLPLMCLMHKHCFFLARMAWQVSELAEQSLRHPGRRVSRCRKTYAEELVAHHVRTSRSISCVCSCHRCTAACAASCHWVCCCYPSYHKLIPQVSRRPAGPRDASSRAIRTSLLSAPGTHRRSAHELPCSLGGASARAAALQPQSKELCEGIVRAWYVLGMPALYR